MDGPRGGEAHRYRDGAAPPNAIVYSSGLLPITRMIKAGAVFDIIGAVLCVVGVTAMANVVGLV
jgi:sodium-dependent dicarboxylate transporter 2/3/5